MWQDINFMPCMFCLAPDMARLQLDKKNRPFLYCRACGTRSFIHRPEGLRGLHMLAPAMLAHAQQLWQDLGSEGMRREDGRRVADLQEKVANNNPWKAA